MGLAQKPHTSSLVMQGFELTTFWSVTQRLNNCVCATLLILPFYRLNEAIQNQCDLPRWKLDITVYRLTLITFITLLLLCLTDHDY